MHNINPETLRCVNVSTHLLAPSLSAPSLALACVKCVRDATEAKICHCGSWMGADKASGPSVLGCGLSETFKPHPRYHRWASLLDLNLAVDTKDSGHCSLETTIGWRASVAHVDGRRCCRIVAWDNQRAALRSRCPDRSVHVSAERQCHCYRRGVPGPV